MSLSAKYQAFLARPSSGPLADNASLHYITTLTSINDAPAIIKHLTVQEKLLKKKGEKVLNAIEAANALSLEVDTTLEFLSGGGAYMPGLDDNFLADRTVIFPVVHMVHFDKNQKISQVRLQWDQGSLLRQIDIIGARGRNWPIRDGKDQARLIATSVGSVEHPVASATSFSRRSTASRGPDEVTISENARSSRSSTLNAMNDPHATLSLFEPRDTNQESSDTSRPVAPRAQSAKPPPREYSELFVGQDPGSPSPVQASPQKERVPTKSGGGQNYKPNRLFDDEDIPAATPVSVKTDSKKYNHFEFGEGEDEATPKVRETSRPETKSKHMSSWNFDDFNTPAKTKPKVLAQQVRHFGWSDDEDDTSPVRRPIVHKPRPDAEAHFEFVDDGTPGAARKVTTLKGRQHNKGLGLYKDHILGTGSDDEDNGPQGDVKRPLGDVTTHVKNENRQKDFGAHWEMKDDSPGPQKTSFNGNGNGNAKQLPNNQQKVLKSLNANWGAYEQSPEQAKKENVDRGINTTGDGMGGRKGTYRSWAIGDQDDEYSAPQKVNNPRVPESKSFWDF